MKMEIKALTYFIFISFSGLVSADYRFLDCFISTGSLDITELLNASPISAKVEEDAFGGYYLAGELLKMEVKF